jgi:hypothetical protein
MPYSKNYELAISAQNTVKDPTEINGLWLRVLTQYLFHSRLRSSVSRLDLKICTSKE